MKKKRQREGIECADGGTVVVKLCENSVMCLTRQVSPLLLSSRLSLSLPPYLLLAAPLLLSSQICLSSPLSPPSSLLSELFKRALLALRALVSGLL